MELLRHTDSPVKAGTRIGSPDAELVALAERMGMPEGVIKRREPLQAFLADRHEVAVKTLFIQLREMGVDCAACRDIAGCNRDFYGSFCDEWEAGE